MIFDNPTSRKAPKASSPQRNLWVESDNGLESQRGEKEPGMTMTIPKMEPPPRRNSHVL